MEKEPIKEVVPKKSKEPVVELVPGEIEVLLKKLGASKTFVTIVKEEYKEGCTPLLKKALEDLLSFVNDDNSKKSNPIVFPIELNETSFERYPMVDFEIDDPSSELRIFVNVSDFISSKDEVYYTCNQEKDPEKKEILVQENSGLSRLVFGDSNSRKEVRNPKYISFTFRKFGKLGNFRIVGENRTVYFDYKDPVNRN